MEIKEEILNEIERFEQCGTHLDVESFISNLREILGRATPEGFVLVPREPTPKMIDATWNFDEEIQNMSHNSRNEFIYKAMIEAREQSSES